MDERVAEHAGRVTFQGEPLTLMGNLPEIGTFAPAFTAVATDLSEVSLADTAGAIRVLVAVPSLDTPVCDMEARRFNDEAAKLSDDVLIEVISMDLPFAQARWCGAAGADRVRTLSDHRDAAFGQAYGVLISELRLLARSVFIVDREGRLRYGQLVNEIANEPDYEAVLRAIEGLT